MQRCKANVLPPWFVTAMEDQVVCEDVCEVVCVCFKDVPEGFSQMLFQKVERVSKGTSIAMDTGKCYCKGTVHSLTSNQMSVAVANQC